MALSPLKEFLSKVQKPHQNQRARSLQLCGLGKLTEQVSEIQYLIYKLALTSTSQIWESWEEGGQRRQTKICM